MMREYPKLLIADKNGEAYDVPGIQAAGMKAGQYFRLAPSDLIELHPDSELFMLPSRTPVGYDPARDRFIELERDPFAKGNKPCFAVAAFPAPGYTAAHNAAYAKKPDLSPLPLFCYSAVAFYKGKFYTSSIRVDREKRQELAKMDMALVGRQVKAFRKIFPDNRLVRHLENCALVYGCPAAKNFFLSRYEAPLPTSPTCNSRCIGCISYQPDKKCSVTQPRIVFVPTPEEIAEVAVFHIGKVADPVVSFGQGCEGEPLMVGDTLLKAVGIIRKSTSKGVINLNTNASKPDVIRRLFDAGMDSIRVSMNSVRERYYNAYYLPKDYVFKDVAKSISLAKKRGGFVSINYLTMPGFTDMRDEAEHLRRFLDKTGIDMIQWRNLNYDPREYFRRLNLETDPGDMTGMRELISGIRKEYPRLMHGYFNPSKGRMKRHKAGNREL